MEVDQQENRKKTNEVGLNYINLIYIIINIKITSIYIYSKYFS